MKISDVQLAKKYIHKASNARSRKIEFSLSFSEFKRVMSSKRCGYTGQEITHFDGPNKKTLDRIDASKGYVHGNVVVCSKAFNEKKGSLTLADIKLIQRLVNRKGIKV